MTGTPIYDELGRGYADKRRPEPRIASQIEAALGDATSVLNVGAGTGSYEPGGRNVVALEPSPTMIEQRRAGAAPAVRGAAEHLPFGNDAFHASLAILTVHHWTEAEVGLHELRRVSRRQVVLTWDPVILTDYWLVRDYLPEWTAYETSKATLTRIAAALPGAQVERVLVPHDCVDGFGCAYWRRPEAYLDPDVRASISGLALLDQQLVDTAMRRLETDLDSGAWHARNADILGLDEYDGGYRLVVAEG